MENFASSGTKMMETVFRGRKNHKDVLFFGSEEKIYIYSVDIGQALEIFKKKQFYFANLEGLSTSPKFDNVPGMLLYSRAVLYLELDNFA